MSRPGDYGYAKRLKRRWRTQYAALRAKLVLAADALEAALYADDESPRLDAAESTLEDLELWLDEHPALDLSDLGPSAGGGVAPTKPAKATPRLRGSQLRYDVQPNKDDPEDSAG
jgi:hypothetical protein